MAKAATPPAATSPAIFTITVEDMQAEAVERIGRQMTQEELQTASKYYENGIEWCEVAVVAIDLAIEDHAERTA